MKTFMLQHSSGIQYELEISKLYEVIDGIAQTFYQARFKTIRSHIILKHRFEDQLILMMDKVLNDYQE